MKVCQELIQQQQQQKKTPEKPSERSCEQEERGYAIEIKQDEKVEDAK